ncbi:SDR family oxidoreductase [Henriciella litoralis]|uniref:SDR family oxidoreductase n=1 Tax=Henriciella litoralis TaxID=568102 RepID=UPI000A02C212|nr:SDR family NAD(P)-dependent oxidoreductase [Henriciella litoralis]
MVELNPSSSTCVITGAASGIGASLARKASAEGYHLLLTDIDEQGLKAVAAETGADYCLCDVSSPSQVESLADRAANAGRPVGAVFANAGVMQMGQLAETTADVWALIVNVNLIGCANVVRSFVPILTAQKSHSHFVATASVAGLVNAPGSGAYNATKQGVVAICETLYQELREISPQVSVSVICPGAVRTQFLSTDRYRHLAREEKRVKNLSEIVQTKGITPDDISKCVFECLKEKRFWIFPQDYVLDRFRARAEAIMSQSPPKWMPEGSK